MSIAVEVAAVPDVGTGEQLRASKVAGTAVAVVGMGYWGRNLVRNFHELGALATVCDSTDDVGTIFNHLACMEGTFRSCETLYKDTAVFAN